MPGTPDARHGEMYEDEGIVLSDTADPTRAGELRYYSGSFKAKDGTGVFDLRTGGSGITAEQHKTLRQLIHFIDDGPAEGFASGAYREITGTVFPSAVIWWESSAKLKKIVEKLLTWTGAFPTVIEWNIYDVDGSTKLATVSDAITWSGAFETSRTRTITVY